MQRRLFLALSASAAALSSLSARAASPPPGGLLPINGPKPSELLGVTGEAWFTDWLNDFYARALAGGMSKAVLDRELSGLSPDPRAPVADAHQPEFARPISAYIDGAVSAGRIAQGKIKRDAIVQFPAIERTYGVPREVLIGVWAMESGFGVQQGDADVVRSLATLASAVTRRRAWAEGELIAALKIIASGEASRAQLKGSWAGAMGQTQFLPSTYLTTAVDGDGDGKRDIWGSAPDGLASAANLLGKGGWKRGETWAREVILKPRFDYSLSEGPKLTPADWTARGARRADGLPWNGADSAAQAQLILPAGYTGPAFLIFANHMAIRTYNNSIAYALSVGLLADRMGGAGPLKTPWPKETALSLGDRTAAQEALARLGFNPGATDGTVGLNTRASLRAWQKSQGLPADGYLSTDMVARLKAAAR